MIKHLLGLCLLGSITMANAQTGLTHNFDDITDWSGPTGYTLSSANNTELEVVADQVGTTYESFSYTFDELDLTEHPYLQISVKSDADVKFRVDLEDSDGYSTNKSPLVQNVVGDNVYYRLVFDFRGRFSQLYPPPEHSVNASSIRKINIYLQPGAADPGFSGVLYLDTLIIGSEVILPKPPMDIKLNQIGFYPEHSKVAVVAEAESDSFSILASDKQNVVFKGKLSSPLFWANSGETVRRADFSSFKSEGTYYVKVDATISSPFQITSKVYQEVGKGLIKSYYYNRASMAIESTYGGKWARAAGHPDNSVSVHASAATTATPAGTKFASPRGWYDAGDYNKYIVNSGISTFTLLSLYEHYPTYFDTLRINLPESNNSIPDLLDEVLWNVRWMLTAQDPKDGSVYHKVSQLNFNGNVMPSADRTARYGIGKSTAAALDFAAVMAQSARIYAKYPVQLPGFADSCLKAAKSAYDWAEANPNVFFTKNPTGVGTGTYGDGKATDEFFWARTELYITTRDDNYFSDVYEFAPYEVPGWPNVSTLGLISIVNHRKRLTAAGYADTTSTKEFLLELANTLRSNKAASPYDMVMGRFTYEFGWGSNATAGNQGLILLQAFRLNQDASYFDAALSNLDYLLGRNGTGYSFITGYGTKSPMHPHHRISEADGVLEPVPGMVVGGANPGQQDKCSGYISSYPARSYQDSDCSYSTNEPAINYTAPVAYLAAGIEATLQGASYTPPVGLLSTTVKSKTMVSVYPNPTSSEAIIEFKASGNARWSVMDAAGRIVVDESVAGNNLVSRTISLENLPQGIYMVVVADDKGVASSKLIKK